MVMSAIGSSAQKDSSLDEARTLGLEMGLDQSRSLCICQHGWVMSVFSAQIDHLMTGIALHIIVTMVQKLGQQLLHQKFHQRDTTVVCLIHVKGQLCHMEYFSAEEASGPRDGKDVIVQPEFMQQSGGQQSFQSKS